MRHDHHRYARNPMLTGPIRFTAALLLALLAGGAVHAQDPEPKPDAAPKVELVPAAEIPVRADSDERYSRSVADRARGADLSAQLGRRLDEIDAATRNLADAIDSADLRRLPAVRLDGLARHWAFYERQLGRWRAELKDVASGFAAEAGELARRRATWDATRAAARESDLAPPLDARITAVLAELAEAERSLSGPLSQEARLAVRASSVETRILGKRATVAAAIRANDEQLLRTDSAPLWQRSAVPPLVLDAARPMRAGIALELDFLRAYVAANAARLVVHGVAIVFLLPVLFWVRHRTRQRLAADAGLEAASSLLLRPVSSWLVVSLMSVLLIEPDAPLLVHEIVLLLALVPVLRILPQRVFETLGPWPYAGTGLYLLYHISFAFAGHPVHHRLYLLALTLVTLGTLVWLLLARRDNAPGGSARGLIRGVGWTSAAALAVSAAANAAGNVTLASVMTGGILDSAYVGLALYAGVSVVGALLRLSIARPDPAGEGLLTRHAQPVLEFSGRLVTFAAVALWVMVTLHEFRLLRPASDVARTVLTYPLEAGNISITLSAILVFGLSVYLAMWVARSIRVLLEDRMLPRMDLPRGVGSSIASLSYYALVVAGFAVALGIAGFETGQLALVVGALGVGIGFGLQNVVNNFVSGLILMFERPIRPGDVIEVAGTSGRVRAIGMRATTVATFEGADVVVPNGALLSGNLINWTLSDMRRRVDVNVGVAYGTDPKRVIELLDETARTTPGVARVPEPVVVFLGFGSSSLDFVVRAWTDDYAESVALRSNLGIRVHDALAQAGIEIPFPQQDLHLRSVSLDAGAALRAGNLPAAVVPASGAPPAATT